MSLIPRIHQKLFGVTAPATNNFITFGSLAAGTPEFTKDFAQIQSLGAWDLGWASATVGNKSPSLEDMNALFLGAFQQIAYILQAGVPLWNVETDYHIGSVCRVGSEDYSSLTDDNVGNDPTTDTNNWISKTALLLSRQYPVGEVYLTHRTGNPATLLGFGTWERVGAGKVPIMLNPSDTDFDTIGKTGGAKSIVLDGSLLPQYGNARADGNAPGGSLMTFPSANGAPVPLMNPYEVLFNAWLRIA